MRSKVELQLAPCVEHRNAMRSKVFTKARAHTHARADNFEALMQKYVFPSVGRVGLIFGLVLLIYKCHNPHDLIY